MKCGGFKNVMSWNFSDLSIGMDLVNSERKILGKKICKSHVPTAIKMVTITTSDKKNHRENLGNEGNGNCGTYDRKY